MNITNPHKRAAFVFLFAFLVIWCRAAVRLEHGFLWAEDAPIFIQQAHQLGIRSLVTNYAGYLHLIPRTIAEVQQRFLPFEWTPYVFVWCCAFLMSGACAYISFALRKISPTTAAFMGLAPVLAPQNGEVLLSITNLQWVLIPALFVLLWEAVFEGETRRVLPRCIAVGALALTGPFGVLALPAVAIGVALRRVRSRSAALNWPVIATYAIAVGVQTIVMLRHPQVPKGAHDFPWIDWAVRAMFGDFLPEPISTTATGYIFGAAVISVCMLSRVRLVFVALFGFSSLLWVLGVTRTAPVLPIVWYGYGARYLYPFGIFMLWSLALVIDTSKVSWPKAIAAVLIFLILLSSGERFAVVNQSPWAIRESVNTYELTVPPGWTVSIPR
ncbi:hypothetical protein [Paraburkholderia aspalathi]|uniref:hypothetical protein n=1 Tax=Paraburkholderia aspalathi TaxID=1324617 RepID=UPI0038B93B1D